jgi:hypothetical protein
MRAGPVQEGRRGRADGDVHARCESRSMEKAVLVTVARSRPEIQRQDS